MQVLAHGAGRQELPQPRRLRAGIAQRPDRLVFTEADQARHRHCRAERAAGRGVVPNPIMRLADRHADAAAGLVAIEHRPQKRAPTHVAFLGDRPGRGDNDAARMRDRVAMQVVHLEDVRQAAKQKGPPRGVGMLNGCDGREHPRWRRIAPTDGAGERIEHEQRGGREIGLARALLADQSGKLPCETHSAAPFRMWTPAVPNSPRSAAFCSPMRGTRPSFGRRPSTITGGATISTAPPGVSIFAVVRLR